jgi:hypothetical protein
MTMTANDSTPIAPGRLGEAIDASELLTYLSGLGNWVDRQRKELDRLGAAALASQQPDSYTSDIVLAETLWEATRKRRESLEIVWDSGRADAVARERMSQLIWGRLDSGGGAELVSLVEAVRLADALVSQLTTRAELERSRELAASDPEAAQRVSTLRNRLEALAEKAGRGADVTGPLGQLVHDSARLERDLIVASSQKRDLARDARKAADDAAAAERREPVLRALAERCRREIVDPPRLAIPDVSKLGPVPQTRAELDAWTARLALVNRAFEAVEDAYAGQLRERAELRYRLSGYHAKAESSGRSASPTVAAGYVEAKAAVDSTPCDLRLARFYVEQYQFLTRDLPSASAPRPGQEGRSTS